MRKTKVGILTFSDGRKYIHESLVDLNRRYQASLAAALEATGQVETVQGQEIIWNPRVAAREGRRLAAEGCDLTICNYAIWCFPHLTAMATAFAPGPFLMFCNVHPSEPGMVGMLAGSGTLDQLDRPHHRIWGRIEDPAVLAKVMAFVRAAGALAKLKGQTYGLFGGRPLGMYTAVSNLDQWQKIFGIDVEHIEQQDVVECSKRVEAEKVENAFKWLEKHVGQIKYDGKALTPEKLKLQIRSYYAFRRIIDERFLDFIGTKAHGDLTDTFVTVDIAEAFLNDPYDWDGPHEPIVAATEADMDGALTMQIFKHITGAAGAVFRCAALRRRGRRVVLLQQRHTRDVLRRRFERSRGEPAAGHVLLGVQLLPGGRGVGASLCGAGPGHPGAAGPQERSLLAGHCALRVRAVSARGDVAQRGDRHARMAHRLRQAAVPGGRLPGFVPV